MTTPVPTPNHRVRRFVLRWLAMIGLICFPGILLVMFSLERTLAFRPSSPAESWIPPVDPETRDISLFDSTGTGLHSWWIPPDRAEAGAIVVAHGNGGNLSHRGKLAADLHRKLGSGVLVFDYPGYGKSDGKPSEQGCYAAGEAALKWLKDEAKIPPSRTILMGESLGGGVAVELATRHDHRALVLVFTFTSLPAVAKFHFPWIPTHTLMRTRFNNLSKIGRCNRPILIAHGTADEVVPFSHGEQLFAAANEPKVFLPMEGATHNLGLTDSFFVPLVRFLDRFAP